MAANAYMNLYAGTVTDGATDGTRIKLGAADTDPGILPLTVALNASTSEAKVIPVALRCQTGFETSGDVKVSFQGTTAAKWSVCDTQTGTFASTLTISNTIGATNKVFYVKASSDTSESPANDTSVTIHVEAAIAAV
jgi:hypothetical protein